MLGEWCVGGWEREAQMSARRVMYVPGGAQISAGRAVWGGAPTSADPHSVLNSPHVQHLYVIRPPCPGQTADAPRHGVFRPPFALPRHGRVRHLRGPILLLLWRQGILR